MPCCFPIRTGESAIKLEQMRNAVEEKKTPHQRSRFPTMTISLGINTVVPSDDLSIGEFIRNADRRCTRQGNTQPLGFFGG